MARPKGAKNKLGGQAKENICAVFTRLGGTAAMAQWAEGNKDKFYTLIYPKLVPHEHIGNPDQPVALEIIHKLS